ncbi:MAG: nucleoside triphosphate pyrophosphohydrolase [Nitrospiraceae bacterium]
MSDRFNDLLQLMATLRAPGGCPWDRKQTHASLKPYLLEEAYEVLETIDDQDMQKLKEELGDLLLQVLFHSQIATESGRFTIEDVMQLLADKLVRRHPHVFGTQAPDGPSLQAEQVVSRWEEIKQAERKASGRTESVLDGVPKALPALLRAFQIQARTSRVGFDWPHNADGLRSVFGKIEEELQELRLALSSASDDQNPSGQAPHSQTAPDPVTEEFGDVLFSLVNLGRFIKVNPEDALRRATNRFADRFAYIETAAAESGRTLDALSLSEMDALWKDAKEKEAKVSSPEKGLSGHADARK